MHFSVLPSNRTDFLVHVQYLFITSFTRRISQCHHSRPGLFLLADWFFPTVPRVFLSLTALLNIHGTRFILFFASLLLLIHVPSSFAISYYDMSCSFGHSSHWLYLWKSRWKTTIWTSSKNISPSQHIVQVTKLPHNFQSITIPDIEIISSHCNIPLVMRVLCDFPAVKHCSNLHTEMMVLWVWPCNSRY